MAATVTYSWTSSDPRQSTLFTPRSVTESFASSGTAFRFVTSSDNLGSHVTELLAGTGRREERVARFEWKSGGGLGRVLLGRTQVQMADLCRPDPTNPMARMFSAPDGNTYRWITNHTGDVLLYDNTGVHLANYHTVRPFRTSIGDVYGELSFVDNGSGASLLPPFQRQAVITCMLYRYCSMMRI
ncbi:hypothetical protein BKA62DRAFT_757838 [Auriculariales sp. MPI-PUGE-AT-0066]|nr:hypothetical protein BKA62DRAFT_757838 [Auriculariales sp. MPI-PUGE-AT-0066]